MLRRVFLLQILLGWFIAITKKLVTGISYKSASAAPLFSDVEPIIFFVAPNGNDAWSGRLEVVNPENSDGPLATLEGAKIAVRNLKSNQSYIDRPIKILLRSGTYFLSQPVLFKPKDSGSINQPITYQSYPQERAIISGGKLITGWRKEIVNNLEMWTVDLPQDSSNDWQFQHLWVNGNRRSRSRYPSQGYLQVEALDTSKDQAWHEGHDSLQYYEGDLPSTNVSTFEGAELVVMNRWVESRLPITKIDPVQRQIYFGKSSVFKLAPGDLYYLENSLDWLNTPGEWYLDRQQGKVYYLPFPEEDISTTEFIAPVLSTLLVFRGNIQKNRYVQHLKFKNITFSHTDWHLPQNASGYSQNAWGVPGVINAIALKNCTWSYCTFAHLGNYALELADYCQYNRISYCLFSDLGGGGIKIGRKLTKKTGSNISERTSYNQVVGNHFFNGGKFFHSAAAIVVVKSHHNLIARNNIHNYYYTAISVMGTWGFEPTQAYQNLIEHNHIHHIGKLSNGDGPIISDMGGIYTLGSQKGTVIRHNKIHDITALRYGGWGIYLDEGSSYITAEHNLVFRTSHGGFAQHYGKENLIRHNIFALGDQAQLHRSFKDLKFAREGNFISFHLENNIFYWQKGKFISGLGRNSQSHAIFNHNIYWKVDQPNFLLGGLAWKRWQQSDRHSVITDPLFIAPQEDNFQLRPNSPAWQLGISKIGRD
ncbi:right-handed parallel beta-helix repeat-containing protein [Pleurocapsa sp. PCC 7319]|uniref:right-handed parallel beta-helix repeat-containing protein n=1 Tax=Pleurocapsa sp. PCC 7319 TaxID=118161 RepID=UPI000346A816|nr:right-handed parallel beta-helix repeat-containing protein [Pleurocapsa sp. PCC 7319]